jgi:2-polyprenyl-3-methyl-5-hydroxy-6-metoxy-1,4-benzoquinol methylase
MKHVKSNDIDYVLGHSEQELERISTQARRFEPFTRQIFQAAGVASGMRVLDVGSGAGDVTFLAADLVGSSGNVVGTDKVPTAVALARGRTSSKSLRNVTFREGDPTQMTFDRPFDAIVGRFILMHCANSSAMLRKLAAHVQPGGVVVFLEPTWSFARSLPLVPLYERCCRWIVEAFRSAGTETDMGIKLHSAFVAAGLPAPSMQMYPIIGGPVAARDWLRDVAGIVNTMQSEIVRLGLATAEEVDNATLVDRLHAEAAVTDSVIVAPGVVGAWARL